MNKEEIRIVPQLRFPEFEEEWKLTELENVVELLSGYAFKDLTYIKGGRKLLIPKNFTNYGYASFNNENTKYTTENPNSKYKCKNGDLLILLTDLTPSCELLGKPLFLLEKDGEVLLNQRISKVITSDKIYSRFLLYFFLTDAFHKRIKNTATGSTVKHSSNKIILNSPISLPTKKEQQKIAACLSSLDEVITAETEKLDLLQDHKKGLLQQLFPAEGETQPKLRFPEFMEGGDWEIDNFSSYIKLYRGSSPRPISQYTTKDENGVNWIKIGDTKNANGFKISAVEEKITALGAKKSRKVKIGELILANSMSYGATYELNLEGCIYDGWFVLREFEESFDKNFLLQLLNSDYLQSQYKRLAAGGIVQNISSEIVYATLLPKPSIQEQQKIADCLSAADELIEAQDQKIQALQEHKKGLLQQLFP